MSHPCSNRITSMFSNYIYYRYFVVYDVTPELNRDRFHIYNICKASCPSPKRNPPVIPVQSVRFVQSAKIGKEAEVDDALLHKRKGSSSSGGGGGGGGQLRSDRDDGRTRKKTKSTHHHHHHRDSGSGGSSKNKRSPSAETSDKVRASHILIKHAGSRRKASWKDPEGVVIANTTREVAAERLRNVRADIVSGKNKFELLASQISDCTSGKRGGDLGFFGRGKMQKPFEEAAFDLKVGEISDLVDTDSGIHIILRTG